MTPKQNHIIQLLVLANVVVYGGLFFAAVLFLPQPERVSEPSSPIAFQQTEATPTLETFATRTPPTVSPTPSLTATPTLSYLPTSTNTPWQLAFSWPTNTPSPTPRPPIRGLDVALPLAWTPARPAASQNVRAPAPVMALTIQGGNSPQSPLTLTDSWQTLDAGASVWHRIGSGGVHMDVFLEANPPRGVTFEVYAPGDWHRPIGQGTLQNSSGRLVWAGGHWDSRGDWLARVINEGPASATYRLTSTAREIGTCDSISYWEYIGTALVYWTRCR